MRTLACCVALAACADAPSREQRVIAILADENYVWIRREPELVAMKLAKMQRDPFSWLRGTAAVFWHDVNDAGDRPATAFGDDASSRVLLVGDPHVENIGTFRTADGTMFIDWNDFDASGYGPYTGDLRRLGTALIVGAGVADPGLAQAAAEGYAAEIARLAAGGAPEPLGTGVDPLLDKLIAKARKKGDAGEPLDEVAPGRVAVLGDIDPVADDGVIEKRQVAVSPDEAAGIDAAIAAWGHPELGAIKVRVRDIGAGVSSYAARRYFVILEAATAAAVDDRIVELKETRDGLILRGVPRLGAAEWDSPGARAIDTQRRLHDRPDGDALLGTGFAGGLSLKIRDRAAYQRGLAAADLATIGATRLLAVAHRFGALLASAHGHALTADGAPGWSVIAPLLAGREAAFAAEIRDAAAADAAQLRADFDALHALDLAAAVGAR